MPFWKPNFTQFWVQEANTEWFTRKWWSLGWLCNGLQNSRRDSDPGIFPQLVGEVSAEASRNYCTQKLIHKLWGQAAQEVHGIAYEIHLVEHLSDLLIFSVAFAVLHYWSLAHLSSGDWVFMLSWLAETKLGLDLYFPNRNFSISVFSQLLLWVISPTLFREQGLCMKGVSTDSTGGTEYPPVWTENWKLRWVITGLWNDKAISYSTVYTEHLTSALANTIMSQAAGQEWPLP